MSPLLNLLLLYNGVMVIGFDGSRAFIGDKTGTENYSYQLLKSLAKIDRENDYKVYIRPGVSVGENWPKNFKFLILNFPFLWTQGGLALQTFKDKLDVLFVPAHTLPIIRKPGLKTVVTVHDLGSEYLPSMHQFKQRLYLGVMQKYQLNTANYIISVSNATKEDLIKRININPQKITVIYEGFDKNLFQPVKNDTLVNSLKQYGLTPQNYFVFVGTVQPRKNIERLIAVYAKWSCSPGRKAPRARSNRPLQVCSMPGRNSVISSEVHGTAPVALTGSGFAVPSLVIAGSKGWLSEEIYKLPKKLGIENRVRFLGYVPDKDLPVLYSGAKAFVFPSLFEGFGLPILEAQACGCPVITSNLSSMPEVAGKGAIYVNPYDIDDIVKGMKEIENGKLRMEKVKLGLENIKRFSWEKCAKETLAVLESVYDLT